jgi:hypothetical protein
VTPMSEALILFIVVPALLAALGMLGIWAALP